jgi:hypothetical protein
VLDKDEKLVHNTRMDIIGIIRKQINDCKLLGVCSCCGSHKLRPEDFTDDLSRKEATISGLCQKCQDEAFADDDEDDSVCMDHE